MQQDAIIAVKCQLGEPDAFDALVARYHAPLSAYARRLTGGDDQAADAVQDIWLRIIRALPGLRDPHRLRSWIFGIAHRALMDRLRARYQDPTVAGLDEIDPAAEPDDDTAEADSAAVHAALDALPIVEREILTLFYLKELSLAEISAALDVPVGTAKSRLFRARKLLRQQLTSENTR
jgi:RNA polymerase sigma factor (sigma-70 family)